MKWFNRLRSLCVYKLVLFATILVALLPISILGYYVYQSAWDDSWREIREKHQLLAQNMSEPLGMFVDDHRAMLAMISETTGLLDPDSGDELTTLLTRSLRRTQGFNSLILMDMQGNVRAYADSNEIFDSESLKLFANEKCYQKVKSSGFWAVSKMTRHPINQAPGMFMGYPVYDEQNNMSGVLLGELNLELVEHIRRKVKFGRRGHSAIVDSSGHVIAHPNSAWRAEIKDLSHLSIVQKMMAGKTGVTQFYSPFIKANMVAGFATVPQTGWGIMVPQPESEVAIHVNSLMHSYLVWGSIALFLAIALAIIVSRSLTKPINNLALAGRELMSNGLEGNLPPVRHHAPMEVQELGTVLRTLISNLQSSRHEVSELNSSLQKRVDEATTQLRQANSRLEVAARHDHLTELANRRYFEDYVSKSVSRRRGDINHICVMLIDIDHFKQINDVYGHAAGDAVLNQLARILERAMRPGDLVARYGGDEFVAYMRCTREVGISRAREIRQAIDHYAVSWDGKFIHATVSIGLYSQKLEQALDINKILDNADNAMYKAKRQGRNRVAELGLELKQVN